MYVKKNIKTILERREFGKMWITEESTTAAPTFGRETTTTKGTCAL